jgi:hypothetical protein
VDQAAGAGEEGSWQAVPSHPLVTAQRKKLTRTYRNWRGRQGSPSRYRRDRVSQRALRRNLAAERSMVMSSGGGGCIRKQPTEQRRPGSDKRLAVGVGKC